MSLAIFKSRGSEDLREYKKAVKMAKEAIDIICELSEDMEEQYSERGYGERGYGERGMSRMHGGYSPREEWEGYEERRGRDSMGRYR
jgi:hypothetical protein